MESKIPYQKWYCQGPSGLRLLDDRKRGQEGEEEGEETEGKNGEREGGGNGRGNLITLDVGGTVHLNFVAMSLVHHCNLTVDRVHVCLLCLSISNGQLTMDASEVSVGNERVEGRPADCQDL